MFNKIPRFFATVFFIFIYYFVQLLFGSFLCLVCYSSLWFVLLMHFMILCLRVCVLCIFIFILLFFIFFLLQLHLYLFSFSLPQYGSESQKLHFFQRVFFVRILNFINSTNIENYNNQTEANNRSEPSSLKSEEKIYNWQFRQSQKFTKTTLEVNPQLNECIKDLISTGN